MGDVGDYWNEHKRFKRAARMYWVECPSASCQFGGNPVKVPPGGKCRHCGWRAPGERGSDRRDAESDLIVEQLKEEARERKKQEAIAHRTCKFCKKLFSTPAGRKAHEIAVHMKRLTKGG